MRLAGNAQLLWRSTLRRGAGVRSRRGSQALGAALRSSRLLPGGADATWLVPATCQLTAFLHTSLPCYVIPPDDGRQKSDESHRPREQPEEPLQPQELQQRPEQEEQPQQTEHPGQTPDQQQELDIKLMVKEHFEQKRKKAWQRLESHVSPHAMYSLRKQAQKFNREQSQRNIEPRAEETGDQKGEPGSDQGQRKVQERASSGKREQISGETITPRHHDGGYVLSTDLNGRSLAIWYLGNVKPVEPEIKVIRQFVTAVNGEAKDVEGVAANIGHISHVLVRCPFHQQAASSRAFVLNRHRLKRKMKPLNPAEPAHITIYASNDQDWRQGLASLPVHVYCQGDDVMTGEYRGWLRLGFRRIRIIRSEKVIREKAILNNLAPDNGVVRELVLPGLGLSTTAAVANAREEATKEREKATKASEEVTKAREEAAKEMKVWNEMNNLMNGAARIRATLERVVRILSGAVSSSPTPAVASRIKMGFHDLRRMVADINKNAMRRSTWRKNLSKLAPKQQATASVVLKDLLEAVTKADGMVDHLLEQAKFECPARRQAKHETDQLIMAIRSFEEEMSTLMQLSRQDDADGPTRLTTGHLAVGVPQSPVGSAMTLVNLREQRGEPYNAAAEMVQHSAEMVKQAAELVRQAAELAKRSAQLAKEPMELAKQAMELAKQSMELARQAGGEGTRSEKRTIKPANPVDKPVGNQGLSKPVNKPADKPADKPVEKPVEKPVAKPVAQPVGKQADKQADKPADKPGGKPVEKQRPLKPVNQPAGKPVDKQGPSKPVNKPVGKPVQPLKPADEPVDRPVQPLEEQGPSKPAGESVEMPVQAVEEQGPSKPAGEPVETPVQPSESADEPGAELAKPVEGPAKPAKEPSDKHES